MITFNEFDYKKYLEMYKDVAQRFKVFKDENVLKEKTWNHWFYYGCKENRQAFCIVDEVDDSYNTINENIMIQEKNNLKYFNTKTKELSSLKPNSYIKDVIIYVNDFELYKDSIIKLYEEFSFLNCNILCPSLIDEEKNLLYFGGYIINNKIELFNKNHYPQLNKYYEFFYNKKSCILFRDFFITNTSVEIKEIINNPNIFQYTELNCMVTPYVKPQYKKALTYVKNIVNNKIRSVNIENSVVIENEILNTQYFTGNFVLKKNKTILICENSIPTPSKDCGSKYIYEFIKLLVKHNYIVHFFSAGNRAYLPETPLFKKIGVYVHYDRHPWHYETLGKFLKNNSIYFDYIFLSRQDIFHNNKEFVRNICPSTKLIYITHDIAHRRLAYPESEVIKKNEFENIEFSDLSLIVSLDEMSYLKEQNMDENKLFYYPICYENVDSSKRLSMNKTKDIYFIGSTHTPNVEAINHFLIHVWSHVRERNSEIKLHIIGSCGEHITGSYDNVEIHGMIDEDRLNYFLNNIRINIVPLLNGGGMKGKVLQSFNHGVPVISSDVGIQGMDIKDMSEVLMIDLNDPVKCADNICKYYKDIELLEKCSMNAMNYFNSNFSSTMSEKYMKNMFNKIDSIPLKQYTKTHSCLVLCVVYKSIDSLGILYDFFKKRETNVEYTFYFILNNERDWKLIDKTFDNMKNTFFVKGDNHCFEFSGFQSLINKMENDKSLDNFDSLLLTNETLLVHYPVKHILNNLDNEIFLSASQNKFVYGLLDSFPTNVSLNNIFSKSWVRGNFILMNMNILKDINYKIQNFNADVLDNDNKCIIPISKEYENLIDKWLLQDRYKNMTKETLRIKKACILNEHYLSALLNKFEIVNLRC